MPRDKRDVEAALEAKGFQRQVGDHIYFVYWSVDGRKSMARTKTSHGSGRDISDDLLGKMANQCGLTKAQFLRLIECPLQRADYETLLRTARRL